MEWWSNRPTWQKIAMVVVAVGLIGSAVSGGDGDRVGTTQTAQPAVDTTLPQTATTPPAPTTTAPAPTTTPPSAEPSPSDFELELFVIENRCFGSAGGLVTVEPELAYDGPPIPANTSYLVVYVIKGGEDGDETYNLTVTGDNYTFDQQVIGTADCDDELTAEITAVRPR